MGRGSVSISSSRKQKLCRVEQGSNCEARELQIAYVMGMDIRLQSTVMVWMQKNDQQKQKMPNILDVLIFSATPRHHDSLCLAMHSWSGYTVPSFFPHSPGIRNSC